MIVKRRGQQPEPQALARGSAPCPVLACAGPRPDGHISVRLLPALSCGLAERRRRVLRPHSLAYGWEAHPLHQDFVNHLPGHVRQAEVTPFELEGELGVVEA